MNNYKENLKKYSTYAIILMPILGTYGFFSKSITIADIAVIFSLIGILFYILIKHKICISNKYFLVFSLWVFISTTIASLMINDVFSGTTIMQLIKFFIYSLLILFISKYFFDVELAEKIYTKVVIILSILVFIQLGMYMITGTFKPWVLNNEHFPPIFVNDDYFTDGYLYMLGGNSFRPSSIFTEPALFAQYVSPCLILNMFKNKSKKKNLILLTITIATLLGKSANGIIYIIIIWIFYLCSIIIKKMKSQNKSIKKNSIIVFFIILLFLPFIYPKLSNFISGNSEYSINQRIQEVFDSKGETSGSMRVVRGWKIFSAMSFTEKIVGIGSGNIINYLNLNYGIVPMFQKSYNGYMSGLSTIFVNFGIIGGTIYLIWWINEFSKKNIIAKSLLTYLLLYLIASNSFLTPQFILTTILIISMENSIKQEEKKDE